MHKLEKIAPQKETTLQQIREQVNKRQRIITRKTPRANAVDYVDLEQDLQVVISMNEELSYKFDEVMKLLPSEEDVETLIVMHTKMLGSSTVMKYIEEQEQELSKLTGLLDVIRKFNKL